MVSKQEMVRLLREERDRWVGLLARLGEDQIVAPDLAGGWSINDLVAHLMVWQQLTVAKLQADSKMHEPVFPDQPEMLQADSDEELKKVNAWIYETHHDQPWSAVYQGWREGFRKILTLSEAIAEQDLLEPGRYAWMEGQPLGDILLSSYAHQHDEHLEPLLAWLQVNRRPATFQLGDQSL